MGWKTFDEEKPSADVVLIKPSSYDCCSTAGVLIGYRAKAMISGRAIYVNTEGETYSDKRTLWHPIPDDLSEIIDDAYRWVCRTSHRANKIEVDC